MPASSGDRAPSAPAPLRQRIWRNVAPNLRFMLLLIAMLVTLFELLRLGLILRSFVPGSATKTDLLWSFIVGLRFDLAIACYIGIAVMFCCYVPWLAPWRGPRTRRVFLWAWSAIFTGLMFLLLCEYEFFVEFQSRFNQLAVRYLNHPATVGGMIWYDYPVIRYALAGLGIGVIVHLWLRLALRLAYPLADQGAPPRFKVEIAGATVIVILLVFGSRGGFQGEPLRWGNAFHGENEYANQMSLNGLYSLGGAIKDMSSRGRTSGQWADGEQMAHDRQSVRKLILAPGERLIDPVGRTVLRQGDVGSSLRLAGVDGKPVNVVVVMMESFSARFVGTCGATRSFTPAIDAIAKDGILFDRAMSAGTHTHQGIFATQLGFPNVPGYETLMESGVSNQPFLSTSEIFRRRGYDTFFLYNGDFSWDNMRGFFQKQGVNTFIGGDEMKGDAKYVDEVWGVSDGDLFDRANREFETQAKTGKPFMAAIMTLSNHSPFQVPPVPGTEPITDMGEYDKRMEAMRYADYAVGKFIDDAKKLEYFKNTLFVFVGDHGFNVPPVLTEVNLLYHHVPLIFYAPGLTDRRGVDHRLATQMNILPSILGLLNISDAPHATWGRSLFNDSFPDDNFIVFKNTGGGRAVAMAQGDDLLVLGSALGKPLLMKFDIGPKATIRPQVNPELEKRMESQLRDYVETAIDDLSHNRAGPVTNSAAETIGLTPKP